MIKILSEYQEVRRIAERVVDISMVKYIEVPYTNNPLHILLNHSVQFTLVFLLSNTHLESID